MPLFPGHSPGHSFRPLPPVEAWYSLFAHVHKILRKPPWLCPYVHDSDNLAHTLLFVIRKINSCSNFTCKICLSNVAVSTLTFPTHNLGAKLTLEYGWDYAIIHQCLLAQLEHSGSKNMFMCHCKLSPNSSPIEQFAIAFIHSVSVHFPFH